jgi:hypothetical protein
VRPHEHSKAHLESWKRNRVGAADGARAQIVLCGDDSKMSDDFKTYEVAFAELTDAPVTPEGVTVAFLRWRLDGESMHVNFCWLPQLFAAGVPPMPDVLRDEIVRVLRFHADRLEARDLDKRMQEIMNPNGGEA